MAWIERSPLTSGVGDRMVRGVAGPYGADRAVLCGQPSARYDPVPATSTGVGAGEGVPNGFRRDGSVRGGPRREYAAG